jgi:hypothetical protein
MAYILKQTMMGREFQWTGCGRAGLRRSELSREKQERALSVEPEPTRSSMRMAGLERWFTPVDDVSANGFTLGILGVCNTIFDAASPGGE